MNDPQEERGDVSGGLEPRSPVVGDGLPADGVDRNSEGHSAVPEGKAPGRALLGVGLVAAGLLWALPLVLAGWLMVVLLAPALGAELLEEADGLRPTTFGGAVWVALALLVAVAVAGRWRQVQRRQQPEQGRGLLGRPGLMLSLGAPLVVAGVLGVEQTGVDLPDTGVAALILVSLFAWLVVLPVQLVGLVWRGARAAWGLAGRSAHLAGLMTGAALTLSLSVSVDIGVWLVEDERAGPWVEQVLGEVDIVGDAYAGAVEAGGRFDGIAAAHAAFEETGERLQVSAQSGFASNDQDVFDRCIHTLVGSKRTLSLLEDAISRLMRRGTRLTVAQDVAHYAVLETCEQHVKERLTDVASWFNAVVNNASRNEYRRYEGRACRLEVAPTEVWDGASPEIVAELRAVDAAMCRLTPEHQLVLRLAVEGYLARDIGARIGKSEVAARKVLSRARVELKRLVAEG